jgi:hypothetical protein
MCADALATPTKRTVVSILVRVRHLVTDQSANSANLAKLALDIFRIFKWSLPNDA